MGLLGIHRWDLDGAITAGWLSLEAEARAGWGVRGLRRMSEEEIQARWVILEVIKPYPVAVSTIPNCHYMPGRDLRQIIIIVTTHGPYS